VNNDLEKQEYKEQQMQQKVPPPPISRIYDVTEGVRSKKTAAVYRRVFKRFLDHIKNHDLQVLLD
jgi:hypothetical protein